MLNTFALKSDADANNCATWFNTMEMLVGVMISLFSKTKTLLMQTRRGPNSLCDAYVN